MAMSKVIGINKRIKTPRMLREEARLGRPLEEIIPVTYEKFGSLEAAAKELGLNLNTMYLWMNRMGIYISRKVELVRQQEEPAND